MIKALRYANRGVVAAIVEFSTHVILANNYTSLPCLFDDRVVVTMDTSSLYIDLEEDLRKFRGPTYNALLEFAAMKKHSLIREVEIRTPAELSAIVVGVSVYEVFADLPERDILLSSMETVKRKQAKLEKEKIFLWMNANLPSRVLTPVMNKRIMRNMDMRMFLARYPLRVLPNPVFRPFVTTVKKFLLTHLFKFRTNSVLYSEPPEFPPEDQLPRFINALGSTEQLEKNYPHLARMKHEMIANITHFTITYCLDWICEVLILGCDRYGFVTYSYPTVEWGLEEACFWNHEGVESLRSDPEISRKRRAELDGYDYDENCRYSQADIDFSRAYALNREELKTPYPKRVSVEEVETAGPSTSKSSTPANQQTSVTEIDSQPASSQAGEVLPYGGDSSQKESAVQDDWTGMLDTALTDPNLPTHYKTMIRCLVASNRDLKNVITMMKSQSP